MQRIRYVACLIREVFRAMRRLLTWQQAEFEEDLKMYCEWLS